MTCQYYQIARNQREIEVARGEGLDGTNGYEDMGCYECDGHKEDCQAYTPPREKTARNIVDTQKKEKSQ